MTGSNLNTTVRRGGLAPCFSDKIFMVASGALKGEMSHVLSASMLEGEKSHVNYLWRVI